MEFHLIWGCKTWGAVRKDQDTEEKKKCKKDKKAAIWFRGNRRIPGHKISVWVYRKRAGTKRGKELNHMSNLRKQQHLIERRCSILVGISLISIDGRNNNERGDKGKRR